MRPAQSGTGLKHCIHSTNSGLYCAAFYQLNIKAAVFAQNKAPQSDLQRFNNPIFTDTGTYKNNRKSVETA